MDFLILLVQVHLFSFQTVMPDRCNQAPQVQANWFVYILKRIV